MSPAERVLSLLEPDPFGGCLLWPMAVSGQPRGGYGLLRVDGKWKRVHRLVCIAVHGPPPELGSVVMHSCDVRVCANPAHLRWGTQAENVTDGWQRTRHRKGPRP